MSYRRGYGPEGSDNRSAPNTQSFNTEDYIIAMPTICKKSIKFHGEHPSRYHNDSIRLISTVSGCVASYLFWSLQLFILTFCRRLKSSTLYVMRSNRRYPLHYTDTVHWITVITLLWLTFNISKILMSFLSIVYHKNTAPGKNTSFTVQQMKKNYNYLSLVKNTKHFI